MSKRSQRKGRSGELELTKIFRDHGLPARPGRVCNFGAEPDISGVEGIHVEVKRVERLRLDVAMIQAVDDSLKFKDGLPTVFHRRDRSEWLVTMRLVDWLELYLKTRSEGLLH